MSLVWTREKRAREAGDSDDPTGTAQRVFKCFCDTTADGPLVALAGCPAVGAAYPGGGGRNATTRTAKELDDVPAGGGTFYEVTIDYSTSTVDPRPDNPLDRPPVVRLSFDSSEEPVSLAKAAPDAVGNDGSTVSITWIFKKAVVNSAGTSFESQQTDTFRDPVITITKNLAVLPWSFSINYLDRLNDDDFTFTYRGNEYTIDKYQAWISDITSEPKKENDVEYEECTLTIKLRKEGWRRKILDQGLYQLQSGDTPARVIRDKDGDPVRKPCLLDGSGAALPSGTQNPVWLRFRFKDEADFSSIPFFD